MNGKEKCEFLRNIRKNMAEVNGIHYEPFKCEHEGDCSGTCAYCENEASELLEEIKEKQKAGETIQIDQEAIALLEEMAIQNVNSSNEFWKKAIEESKFYFRTGLVLDIEEE